MIKVLTGLVLGVWIEGYLRRKGELSDRNLAQIVSLWELMDDEQWEYEDEGDE